jgi:carbon-monoxide dehydrogenase medium subunit
VDDPGGQADDEKRYRETRLLPVELAGPAELVEDERQAGESAGWRAHRELSANAQEVRDRQDDHMDGDERHQVEVGALHGGKGAVRGVHGQMMAHASPAKRRRAQVSLNLAASAYGALTYAVNIRAGLLAARGPPGGAAKGEADMIPAAFEYAVARDVADAIQLLASSGGEGKVLAGGQSLIPLMRFRLAQPALVVDLNRVPGLAQITENGELRIGALVREADLDTNAIVRDRYPILVDTTRVIADPLVRNLATVGGNLAHADPANNHPATMLALRASLVAQGQKGERVIPIDDFFVDTFTTVLGPDEILTEIRIPKPAARSGGAYLKLERKVGDFAIVGVAVMIALDEKGTISAVDIGLTNAGPTPMRARNAEDALRGQSPDEKALAVAGAAAAAEAKPWSDLRGPEEYKRDMIRVLTQRAIRKAVARATGGK